MGSFNLQPGIGEFIIRKHIGRKNVEIRCHLSNLAAARGRIEFKTRVNMENIILWANEDLKSLNAEIYPILINTLYSNVTVLKDFLCTVRKESWRRLCILKKSFKMNFSKRACKN